MGFIDDVDDLFVDGYGQAVIVGADPEPAFLVHVQTVDIPDGIIAVHPSEFLSVVAV